MYREEDRVLGFVSCAVSSKGIMRRFLLSGFTGILQVTLAFIKNPSLLKPLWETFRAPSLSKSGFDVNLKVPETELLSIAVDPGAQKAGIGAQLLSALEKELIKKEIHNYKVIAGDKLEGANRFYSKNGFVLAKKICIHNNDISNVYVKQI